MSTDHDGAFSPFEAYARTYATMVEASPGYQIVPVGRPGSLLCTLTPFPMPSFNRVMTVRLGDDEASHAIAKVKAIHRDAGVRGSWWLDAESTPAGLDHAIEREGYLFDSVAPVMVRDMGDGADDLPDVDLPDGFELSFVRGREAMREAQLVAARGFERPADVIEKLADVLAGLADVPDDTIRVVAVKRNGVVVATATGVTTGTICGVHSVATLPEARGVGLGRATTLAVLHDANDRGARTAVLHASRMAFGIYARMGFRHVGNFRRFFSAV